MRLKDINGVLFPMIHQCGIILFPTIEIGARDLIMWNSPIYKQQIRKES